MAKVRKRMVVLGAVAGLLISVGLAWYNHQQGAEQRKAHYLSEMVEQVNHDYPDTVARYEDSVITVYPESEE